MSVTGSVHDDMYHNHTYFLCSNQGKIEVVPWDCNSFGMHAQPERPVDEVRHPIGRMVLADPRWVHRRNQHIYELLNSHTRPDNLHRLIDETLQRMRPDLEADPHLSLLRYGTVGWKLIPCAVTDIPAQQAEIKDWARRRHEFLTKYVSHTDVRVRSNPDRPGWTLVEVAGSVAVRLLTKREGAFSRDSAKHVADILYPGLAETDNRFLVPQPLLYQVEGAPSDLHFVNAITGEPVAVTDSDGSQRESSFSLHPPRSTTAQLPPIVLGPGTVILENNLITLPGQSLTIRAGTKLMLRSGVGIYARGQTFVEGTQDEWVEIEPADAEPWASFGISGAATKGSRIEYLRMSRGSVGTNGSVRFKGMLSIYDCPHVALRHCEFGNNLVGDDAVNLAESGVVVEDCIWEAARADALDLDMCIGVVRRCQLYGSGNDGLDLMNCTVLIEDCQIEGSGDKGISVGEQSSVVGLRCAIRHCAIGVEIKDASRFLLRDSSIDAAGVAVNSYRKKWLYAGDASAALVDCIVRDSQLTDLQIEKQCQISLVRSSVVINESARSTRITSQSRLDSAWRDHESDTLQITELRQ